MSLRKNKQDIKKVFFIGLLLSVFIFLPFLIYDKGLFIYYGDFDVQQLPFYRLSHDAVQSGGFGWNWNTDLGANFIGSYSFYTLGSPFFWLTVPFPSEVVPYLMAPLLMLKFALTSVTGYAYVNRFTRSSQMAMLGGLMYAFSGFNVYNIFFNHFNEVVMMFPLLLIGIEEYVVNHNHGAFAIAVAACAIVNYYFFFGQVVFCVIYFFVRLRSKDFKVTPKQFLLLFAEAVIGLLLAAFLLVPSLVALMGNTRTTDTIEGFNTMIYGNSQRYGLILSSFFFPPDIPARPNFFPDSNAKWSSVSMFLPLFSTVGVIAFLKGQKKHFAKILMLISLIICFVPFLNAAFSAFNYSYYARWFYMPILIMSLMTAMSLEDNMEHYPFAIKVTSCFVAFFTLIGIMPKRVEGELVWFSLPEYPERFWAYVLVAVFGLLCMGLLYMFTNKHKRFMTIALSSFCGITLVFSIFMIFTGKLAGNGYDIVVDKGLNGSENISLQQKGFYRIDSFDEMDNLGMFLQKPTINAFHSVVPASISEYYNLIGGERGVASRPEQKYIGARAMLNVKYNFALADKKDRKHPVGFAYYDIQNGYEIYENEHFVPMGVGLDRIITEEQLDKAGVHKDRLLLKGLYLYQPDEEIKDKYEKSDETPINVGTQYLRYAEALPVLEDDEAYSSELSDELDYFASCDALASRAVNSFTYDSNGFWATYTAKKDEFLFFSVPYDRGFSATVNGEEVEIIKANGGFMAVEVSRGNSTVVFTYRTPGLFAGIIITICALVAYVGYMFLCFFLQKRDPMQYRYSKTAHLPQVEPSIDYLYINENSDYEE